MAVRNPIEERRLVDTDGNCEDCCGERRRVSVDERAVA
jgi:hypothetical protein